MTFDFICNLYSSRYSTIKNLKYSIVPFSPQGLYLKAPLRLKKIFVYYDMDYNSKNIRAVGTFFSVEVDETFLKVCGKNLVKVTKIPEVMGRKRPPTFFKGAFI